MSTGLVIRRFALAYTLALIAAVGGLAILDTYPSPINMLLAFAAAIVWSVYPVRRALAPPIPSTNATGVVVLVSLMGAAVAAAYTGYILLTSAREGLWRSLLLAYLAGVAAQAVVAYIVVNRSVSTPPRAEHSRGG